MTTKARRRIFPRDLRLRLAIVGARKTQRRVAIETRIGEVRLGRIVHDAAIATPDERKRIAKYLECEEATLFPPLDAASDEAAEDGSERTA